MKHFMAWNEPDDTDKKTPSDKPTDKKESNKKDPWSGQSGRNDNPPDLDEIFNKIKGLLFGDGAKKSGGNNSGTSSSGGNPFGSLGHLGLGLIVGAAIIVWVLSGIYIIDEGKRGVVLRLGKYLKTSQPGPHWRPNFIDTVLTVDLERNRDALIGYRVGSGGRGTTDVPSESLMLTKDENIVDVKLAVQYRISDAAFYMFNNRSPELALREATESALREVIGKSSMDYVLTEGRADVAASVQVLTQKILDRYNTGLIITSVNMQDAQPPDQVQNAFHDAVKAREDQVRLKNEAEAYSNDILPKARGNAARQIAESQAYKNEVVSKAKGEASRFSQVYAEYKLAPDVMRERLYIDTMEQVMSNANKVMIDVKSSNNLLYLPLDKMGEASNNALNPPTSIQVMPVIPESMKQRLQNASRAAGNDRLRSRER